METEVGEIKRAWIAVDFPETSPGCFILINRPEIRGEERRGEEGVDRKLRKSEL